VPLSALNGQMVLERSGSPTAIMATPVCWFEDVLGAERATQLLRDAVDEPGDDFIDQPAVFELQAPEVMQAVVRKAALVCEALGGTGLEGRIGYTSIQHSAGEYTQLRSDNASGGGDAVLSFSYFLHSRPKEFTGGQLRVFDLVVRDGQPHPAHTYREIHPDHDTLVFFPSMAWYAVGMVEQARRSPLSGRISLQGWVA